MKIPSFMPRHLLPTTVVGSYPQPEWLVDRAMLSKVVPRTRMHAMWRLAEEHLEEAQDDATIVAIRDMERAGIDIVTDGEIRRESYSNRFATALEGIDSDNPAIITARNGQKTPVPRVVGPVRRSRPVELRDMEFLRRNTDRAAKITLPGPFTMSQQAKNEFYKDDEELAMAFADAVNAEAHELQKAGADVIQLDEPWVRNNPELARRYAVKAINRALEGITVPTTGATWLFGKRSTAVRHAVRAETALIAHPFPRRAPVKPQKSLLDHVLGIMGIAQDGKRHAKHKRRLPVHQSGKQGVAIRSVFVSRQHGSRERDLSVTAVMHEARSQAKTVAGTVPFIIISVPPDQEQSNDAAQTVARTAHMRHLVETLRHLEAKLREGGGAERIEKQHRAGKLTARERIDPLLDPARASSKSASSSPTTNTTARLPPRASSPASARSKAAPPSSSPTTPP